MSDYIYKDLRVQRTKAAIRATFRQMLCEIEYEKITIKELTERARINRKTFYLHYSKLDDLLDELRSELVNSFMERIGACKLPRDQAKFVREFFLCQEELGALGERLVCVESNRYIIERAKNNIVSQSWDFPMGSDDYAEYMKNIHVSYVSHCVSGVYRQWIEDGKIIPLEDLIDLAIALICNGTNGFLELISNNNTPS